MKKTPFLGKMYFDNCFTSRSSHKTLTSKYYSYLHDIQVAN